MASAGRTLVSLNLKRIPRLSCDVLVVGSGIAGLTSALHASSRGASVILVSKGATTDSNTWHAQGGVAVALSDSDSTQSHFDDTIRAGSGLCDEAAVRKLVSRGPAVIRELLSLGAPFDTDGGKLAFGREGAHSTNRVLHASGDGTGREMARALLTKVRNDPGIETIEHLHVVDLISDGERVFGAVAMEWGKTESARVRFVSIEAGAVVIATGGMGRLYRETTNPEVATGDGVAAAYRAGAEVVDVEFVQFHPTALYVAGAPRLLISEAVRGEGAILLNTARERFMPRYHKDAELAPRDVVSAAIVEEMGRTRSPHIYIDMTRLDEDLLLERFPTIADFCATFGLDITSEIIPVRPAAHYAMGGVRAGLDGSTNLDCLFACGEAASTGVHGANRLASNSLLEGLVFGTSAGEAAADAAAHGTRKFPSDHLDRIVSARDAPLDVADLRRSLQAAMWRQAGIFRSGEELKRAMRALSYWREFALRVEFKEREGIELQNMIVLAELVCRAALEREESRGAHRRTDFPETSPEWQKHITQTVSR